MKLRKVKNILKCFDLFAKPVTLRYSGEPEYETVTGGLCSIALVVVFVSVFTGTLLNTLNKTYIYSTTTRSEDVDPTPFSIGTDKFMFALGLSGINMNQGQRWFDVVFEFRNYRNLTKSKISIPLQMCTKEQWTNIDPNFSSFYDRLKLQEWLCPMSNFNLQLQGKYTSEVFKFYKIGLRKCNSTLNLARPCVSDSQIDAYLNNTQSFNLNFYFVNTILNPESQKHISYYINDFNYFPFSTTTGCNTNLYVSTYSVKTDQSIYPTEDFKQETGGIVVTEAQMLNYEVRQIEYLKLNIRKSSLSLQVDRSYRKLDDTVSYIGGLFSAIISALIIIGLYNQYSYQLDIAQNLYHYEKNQSINAHKFNIFFFIGYLFYALFLKIGIHLSWKRMEIYHKSLEEIRKQMDVKYMFRKLNYVENVANLVLDDHQTKVIHLHGNSTLKEAQDQRKNYKFFDKLGKYYLECEEEKANNLLLTTEGESDLVKFNDKDNDEVKKDKSTVRVQTIKINVSQFNELKLRSNKQTQQKFQPKQKQKIKEIIDRIEDEDDEAYQEPQLNKNIRELKNSINILKKQCQEGQKNSIKLLNCTNPTIISLIQQIEESHTEQNRDNLDFEKVEQEKRNESKKIVHLSFNKSFYANQMISANSNEVTRNEPKSIEDIQQVLQSRRRRR